MVVDFREAMKKEMRRRKYSDRTIKTYLYCVDKFFSKTKKTIDKISKTDVREYLTNIAEKKTGNTTNVNLNALKFLFEDILGKRMKLDIKYSKVPEKLPVVLTKQEVKRLFDAINNEKHKLMIQLMYSAGLRVSELINLKVEDLKINEGYGYVRQGKGNKDRLFIIAESLKEELKKFIAKKKISEYNYLFISNRERKYSVRSLQQIIKKAGRKAGIVKNISCHTLRHSFATHLIENGSSLNEVQSLLGHKSPETTLTYLHNTSCSMINIKSPLDSL